MNGNAPPLPRPQAQTASKLVTSRCKVNNLLLVGVHKPCGVVYYYEYNRTANSFHIHSCVTCQPPIFERYLQPYYAEYDKEIRKKVLFARNSITSRTEQFAYSFQTNILTQVHRPKLVFDAQKYVNRSNVIAFFKSDDGKETVVFERSQPNGLRKLKARGGDGTFDELPEAQLTLLSERGPAEDPNFVSDYAPTPMEQAYFNYLAEASPVRHYQCFHMGIEFLWMFNTLHHRYYPFFFNEQVGGLVEFNCSCCTTLNIMEVFMIPKYMQPYKGASVIHMLNMQLNVMEQYVYDGETEAFEQVYYPELRYDQAKDAEGIVICVEQANGVQTVIMRDHQNRLRKEYYSDTRRKFVVIPPAPVLTILAKRDMEKEEEQEDPDIIELGVKNPLADEDGVIPIPTNFTRVFPKSTRHGDAPQRDGLAARIKDLPQEASTSGVGWHQVPNLATTSTAQTLALSSVSKSAIPQVEATEELTKNQKKKLKKKAKKAAEAAEAAEAADPVEEHRVNRIIELTDPATGEFHSMEYIQEQVWALGERLKQEGVLHMSYWNPKPVPSD